MNIRSCIMTAQCLILGGVLAVGCSGVASESTESTASIQQNDQEAYCKQSDPEDMLVAELVERSLRANYPLTRLAVDANGVITAAAPPDSVAGMLEIINTVEPARAGVAAALATMAKAKPALTDYSVTAVTAGVEACENVPAWTPNGSINIVTQNITLTVAPEGAYSWHEVHKAFRKECPLLKNNANDDSFVDPPGDGSTSLPPSTTVSETGVIANGWGLCPTGTPVGTYCRLAGADQGPNYTGRKCTLYYGTNRCLIAN